MEALIAKVVSVD